MKIALTDLAVTLLYLLMSPPSPVITERVPFDPGRRVVSACFVTPAARAAAVAGEGSPI
jgi:hypothetical protein